MRRYPRPLVRAAVALVVLAATASAAPAQFRARPMMMPGSMVPMGFFRPMPFVRPMPLINPMPFPSAMRFSGPLSLYGRTPFGSPRYPMPAAYAPYAGAGYAGMMYAYPSGYSPSYGGYGSGYSGSDTPTYSAGSGTAAPKNAAILADEPGTVMLYDNYTLPEVTTITAGGTVTWKNVGKHRHTVTSVSGKFASGDLEPGDSFTHTFAEAGRWGYYCAHHRGEMYGTVVVQAPAGGK